MTSKLDLAKKSFDHVLDMDQHMDSKASRTLSAMAFLTAASAAIFANAYAPDWPREELEKALTDAFSTHLDPATLPDMVTKVIEALPQPYTFLGLDWLLLSFSLYLGLVLLGAVFYLGAIGPTLNIPTPWRRGGRASDPDPGGDEVKSLLFYHQIAGLEKADWTEHWQDRQPDQLAAQMEECYIQDTHILAEKAEEKRKLLSWGNVLFRGAFFFWVALLAGLWSTDPWVIWPLTLVGWALVCSVLAITAWMRIPRQSTHFRVLLLLAVGMVLSAILVWLAGLWLT